MNNGPVWVDGRYGKALSFDGVDDYVRVEVSSYLDVTEQVTVEAWVYPRAYIDYADSDSHIISRCNPSGGHIYVLETFHDGRVGFSVNPVPEVHSSVATIPLVTWTHLAMTYNGTEVRLYINGDFDSSYPLSGPIQTTTNWVAIGCKPTGPSGGAGTYAYFNGTIDDVRIYNKALTQQQIQSDMNNPCPYYDWPMFHHDSGHRGYSASRAPNNNKTLWTALVQCASSPAVANGKVFASSVYGNVYALDASTGSLIWNTLIDGQAYVSPAVAEGKVFVGYTVLGVLDQTTIWALNETTGAKIWNYTIEHITGSPQHIAPTYADGKVFIGPIADEKVYALNATTGEYIWSYATGDAGSKPQSNPAVVDNVVFVGSQDFKIYALNATTGMHIWNFSTGGYVTSSPVVSNGKIFVGSADGKLYAINQTTGTHLWNSTCTSFTSSPAVADGIVFIGFEAFNETTGELLWRSPIETSSSPAVADGKVFIASDGGDIFALNKTTGDEIWNFKTDADKTLFNSPAVAYDKVFVSLGSTFYAFGIHDVNITDVKLDKTVVGKNFTTRIHTKVTNDGGYTETFKVTTYANTFIIQTQTVTLKSGAHKTLNFTWDTTNFAKGNYTISAVADIVPSETDITDNALTDGWTIIAMIGDITGPDGWPDGKCDIRDIALIAKYFGQEVPPAPPNCDITGPAPGVPDNKVDIRDVATVAIHFGEIDP